MHQELTAIKKKQNNATKILKQVQSS